MARSLQIPMTIHIRHKGGLQAARTAHDRTTRTGPVYATARALETHGHCGAGRVGWHPASPMTDLRVMGILSPADAWAHAQETHFY